MSARMRARHGDAVVTIIERRSVLRDGAIVTHVLVYAHGGQPYWAPEGDLS